MQLSRLEDYIEKLDRPNTNLEYGILDVCGVTNTKEITKGTKANLIGRTFEKFTILYPREFIFNRRTSRNGEKISIGFNNLGKNVILTEDYCHFRIKKDCEDKLLPEYLYLYFLNPEFDRYARYNSWGSATEFFNWEEMCDVSLHIPELEEQKKIVESFTEITERIETLSKENNLLLDIGNSEYQKIIVGHEKDKTLLDLIETCETGKRPKGGAVDEGIPSIGAEKIDCFGFYDFTSEKYVPEDFYRKMKNGKIESGDILLYKDGAYTGNVSMALNGFPHLVFSINEHVFKINTKNNYAQTFLYFTLSEKYTKKYINDIASSKSGQPGLNQEELFSVEIAMPDKEIIRCFEEKMKDIMDMISYNALEIKYLVYLKSVLLRKYF